MNRTNVRFMDRGLEKEQFAAKLSRRFEPRSVGSVHQHYERGKQRLRELLRAHLKTPGNIE